MRNLFLFLFLLLPSISHAAIAINLLTSGVDETDATVYTTASISNTTNALVLIAIENRQSTQDEPSSLSGLGLTWVKVQTSAIGGSNRRLTVWRGMGTGTSGTITINYPATQTHCMWTVLEFTGVDTSGTNGSGAVVQSPQNKNNASPHTVISVTMSAVSSANNMTYGAFTVNNGAVTGTPASGYTEDYDLNESESGAELEIAHKLNDNAPSCTWSANSSASLGIAIEVKASTPSSGGFFNLL